MDGDRDMGKFGILLPIFIVFVSFSASARWVTSSDDDVFSGGQKATMFVSLNEYNSEQAFVFDCTKDDLSFSYIEKSPNLGKVKIPVKMIVKIDSGAIINIDGETSQRNSEYSEITASDRESILKIMQEARKATSKMIVGLSVPEIDVKQSYSANVAGSKKAIDKFMAACEIK